MVGVKIAAIVAITTVLLAVLFGRIVPWLIKRLEESSS